MHENTTRRLDRQIPFHQGSMYRNSPRCLFYTRNANLTSKTSLPCLHCTKASFRGLGSRLGGCISDESQTKMYQGRGKHTSTPNMDGIWRIVTCIWKTSSTIFFSRHADKSTKIHKKHWDHDQ